MSVISAAKSAAASATMLTRSHDSGTKHTAAVPAGTAKSAAHRAKKLDADVDSLHIARNAAHELTKGHKTKADHGKAQAKAGSDKIGKVDITHPKGPFMQRTTMPEKSPFTLGNGKIDPSQLDAGLPGRSKRTIPIPTDPTKRSDKIDLSKIDLQNPIGPFMRKRRTIPIPTDPTNPFGVHPKPTGKIDYSQVDKYRNPGPFMRVKNIPLAD